MYMCGWGQERHAVPIKPQKGKRPVLVPTKVSNARVYKFVLHINM